jgi:hypothetical protein
MGELQVASAPAAITVRSVRSRGASAESPAIAKEQQTMT